jgi:hypothetical protein
VTDEIVGVTGVLKTMTGNRCVLTGVALQLTIVVLLFMWTPSPYEVYFLFIISILWGLADALSQIQLNG